MLSFEFSDYRVMHSLISSWDSRRCMTTAGDILQTAYNANSADKPYLSTCNI